MVRKFKERFCVRGDQQEDGVDAFETFAPVVQWDTIRLMQIISIILELKTVQVDYTNAFLHALIDTEVFVEIPRGFREPGKVLRLFKSLYGLKKSPRNFFHHLRDTLLEIEFRQSHRNEFLFWG